MARGISRAQRSVGKVIPLRENASALARCANPHFSVDIAVASIQTRADHGARAAFHETLRIKIQRNFGPPDSFSPDGQDRTAARRRKEK